MFACGFRADGRLTDLRVNSDMAKTSDFALKLLDDLRLRKERMAASSRDSKATNPMVADAYAYSKTAYRSSREQKTLIDTGSKAGSARSSSSGGRKSVTAAPVSNQIVPFGRHQKSKKIGDPSPAVAFTLENGGKGGRTEFSVNSSMFNFLHNIGRKQMDNGKIGRRNSNLPTVSQLDIEAISRGVQNLNQILIACSNGLNFDRYSIEIGHELLKGAMDLDKSLRMLANLQEPSKYSTTKSRGSRITLLDEDEDDDDDEQQLDISSFSLGRPLRNYNDIQDVARTDLMLRLKDLTDSSKVTTTNSKHGKKVPAASNSHSHKQSLGYGPEIKTLTTFSEQNQSRSLQCKQEKLRFPNVIAKLMGIDELPRNVDSKVTAKESGKQPGKVLTNTYGSIRVAAHDKLPRQKESEDIKPKMSSRKATIKTDKQQSGIVRLSHNYANRKEIQEERRHDNVKHREQKIAERSEIKELVFEDEMQQMKPYVHKRSETAHTLQENRLHGFEQVSVLRKSELEKKRGNSEERKQQSTKQKLQSKQKQNEPTCGNFSESMSGATATNLKKKQPQMNQAATSRKGSTKHIDATHDDKHHKNQADDRSLKNLNIKIQCPLNRHSKHSQGDQESESAKAIIRFTVDEKPVQLQPTMKARIEKGNNLKVPRINEVMTQKGASVHNLLSTLKHQSSGLQERKQVRLEQLAVSRKSDQTKAGRLKEVEPKINRSNKSISSIPQERRKAARRDPVFCSLREDECQKLNKSQALVYKDSGQTSVPKDTNEQQDQEPDIRRAKENQFKNSASDPQHRTNEANVYEKTLNQRTYTLEMPEPLTEGEDHFKQILMKSQLFMHTAKALFKVSIPMSVLPGDGDDYHEQESKLILDCGYEVMKRKGKRQELSAHPFLKASIATSNKAKSMDDMVKQICKDFDKLKLYGREGKEDSSFENYLPKMVEADVYEKEPDLNCMWDLGWNPMMFACLEKDDVIRDVERYVLNELLVGITKDLLTTISVTA